MVNSIKVGDVLDSFVLNDVLVRVGTVIDNVILDDLLAVVTNIYDSKLDLVVVRSKYTILPVGHTITGLSADFIYRFKVVGNMSVDMVKILYSK